MSEETFAIIPRAHISSSQLLFVTLLLVFNKVHWLPWVADDSLFDFQLKNWATTLPLFAKL